MVVELVEEDAVAVVKVELVAIHIQVGMILHYVSISIVVKKFVLQILLQVARETSTILRPLLC